MNRRHVLLRIGFSLILIGYLLEWIPHNAAGLSIIGHELGEWVKFIHEVGRGEVFPGRNFLFLPPWILGMMMLAWTVPWTVGRWQTWSLRVLAVFVTLLALPPIEVIRFEASDQWLPRITLILVAMAFTPMTIVLKKLPKEMLTKMSYALLVLLALIGIIFSSWAFLAIRGPVGRLVAMPTGLGVGIWVCLLGDLFVLFASLSRFRNINQRGRSHGLLMTQKDDA